MALIKCPECKQKISSEASNCPKCGRPLTDEDRKPKKGLSVIKTMGIVFVVVIAVGLLMGKDDKAKEPTAPAQNATAQPQEEPQTFEVMGAVALWKEFEKNEVAAERKYKGKQVAIEGKIFSIETSFTGYPEIVFDVSYGIQTVRCQFSKSHIDQIAEMSKGQKVIVIGTVESFVLGSVLSLDKCTFGK